MEPQILHVSEAPRRWRKLTPGCWLEKYTEVNRPKKSTEGHELNQEDPHRASELELRDEYQKVKGR